MENMYADTDISLIGQYRLTVPANQYIGWALIQCLYLGTKGEILNIFHICSDTELVAIDLLMTV